MVNNVKVNKHINIINSIVGIKRKRLFFESEQLLIYSPTIQSNTNGTDEAVDILSENMDKIIFSNKPVLIIIRYYNDFLILEGEKLKKVIEENSSQFKKRSLKVKKKNHLVVEVYIPKSDFSMELEIYDYKKFKNVMEDLYNINFEENLSSEPEIKHLIPHIEKYIKSKGFNYSLENIKNLYLSLRSKPFVIISGISGTGKTKIAQLFAESIGANETNGQFTLIPVRPDWSDGSELLGYKDLSGTFMEGPLTKVVREASENVDRPYFILLDEMNLARVEYYFSDMLSIMESRKKVRNSYTSALLLPDVDRQLTLPENVYIIGTVNMDETTHPFSKKVLDRANTIEFNEIDLMSFTFLETAEQVEPVYVANGSLEASYVQLQDCFVGNELLVKKVSHELSAINEIIEPLHAHVGYRVRDEICFYMIHNSEGALLSEEKALDYCIMQKILPRLAGSGLKIHTVLEKLFAYFTGTVYDAGADFDEQIARYPQSAKKVNDMLGRLEEDDFTSFWIS